ncbi:MAG: hypothetical protein J6I49_02250 [Bacteroidales bacterium]|nr:hypothetical protein [Bacteroidales bacterium]
MIVTDSGDTSSRRPRKIPHHTPLIPSTNPIPTLYQVYTNSIVTPRILRDSSENTPRLDGYN